MITPEEAKILIIKHVSQIKFDMPRPFHVWISDLLRQNKWGYYFYAGPYLDGEDPESNALTAFVDKNTGEVSLAANVM